MAMDFPAGPTTGQTYTFGGVTYTWNGYAWLGGGSGGTPPAAGDYVLKTGDTMTGHLTLNADPTVVLHAATKQYVDAVAMPPVGNDGEALVADTGLAVWGAPIEGGNY